jgi:hypothetical protein
MIFPAPQRQGNTHNASSSQRDFDGDETSHGRIVRREAVRFQRSRGSRGFFAGARVRAAGRWCGQAKKTTATRRATKNGVPCCIISGCQNSHIGTANLTTSDTVIHQPAGRDFGASASVNTRLQSAVSVKQVGPFGSQNGIRKNTEWEPGKPLVSGSLPAGPSQGESAERVGQFTRSWRAPRGRATWGCRA